MPDTISVKEAALRWDLAERTIRGLCNRGNIPGAYKTGRDWKIPADAQRPIDNRIKTGAYIQPKRRAMHLPLPVGVSDYRLASTEYYYIDKTMMIKDFLDERPMVSLFTRPRRFGKTLNMDMLRTFFEKTDEDTSRFFIDKKIWTCGEKYRAYQGKYPVIFITLKDVKCVSWDETYKLLYRVIRDEYARHGELMNSSKLDPDSKTYFGGILNGTADKSDLTLSLLKLSHMLYHHHGEGAIIIIDEYDTPIQSGHTNGFYNEVISFMRNLLSACLKDNKCLAFGFLTGILRVAKESIFSGLNNIVINSVLDSKYSEYFGFTSDEVKEMAKYYGNSDKYDEICEWYDGYRFGNTDIFNPWSVVNYFSNKCEPRTFWLSTGSNDIIGEIMEEADDEIVEKLTSLVNGGSFTTYIDTSVIYPQVKNNPSSLYSFLLVAGYLKVIKSTVSISGDFMCEVALPNKEISLVYRKEILQKLEKMIPQSTAIAVQEAIFSGDGKKLSEVIRKLLIQSVSSFDTAKENFYHGFMLGICALLGGSYTTSNRESGEGRYDIQLSPESKSLPGIIIELKAEKNCSDSELKTLAETALRQINGKKYDTEMISKGVKTVYKYGVAFSGKKVEVATGQR